MKPTKKQAKPSDGDNRNSAARKTAMPGKPRGSLKKGLDAFWAKREQKKPE